MYYTCGVSDVQQRANAVNRFNNKWPPFRVFAIVLIIINWATLISLMVSAVLFIIMHYNLLQYVYAHSNAIYTI
jgi:hypothetical protein